jgi:hypothetical protein
MLRKYDVDKVIGAIVVFAIISLAITGMILAWRKRVARDSRFSVLFSPEASVQHMSQPAEFSGLYVSTTLANNPLQRVTLPGLAFRADSSVLVSDDGVTIAPRGEAETFIPAQQIVQIHRTQVTIDKAVERDGLTAISWLAFDNLALAEVEFTSFFRFSIPEIRIACETSLTSFFPNNNSSSKEVTS